MPFSLLVSRFSPLSPQSFFRKKAFIPVENHMVIFFVRSTFGMSLYQDPWMLKNESRVGLQNIAMNLFFSSRGVTDDPAAFFHRALPGRMPVRSGITMNEPPVCN